MSWQPCAGACQYLLEAGISRCVTFCPLDLNGFGYFQKAMWRIHVLGLIGVFSCCQRNRLPNLFWKCVLAVFKEHKPKSLDDWWWTHGRGVSSGELLFCVSDTHVFTTCHAELIFFYKRYGWFLKILAGGDRWCGISSIQRGQLQVPCSRPWGHWCKL